MAIGWLTVLKSVPWGEVINNAPKVADGAKKLWKAVARKPPSGEAAPSPQSELARLGAAVDDLHRQMVASSELIKALAEQNTELVRRIELNRVRLIWLGGAAGVIAVITAWALVIALLR